MTHVEAISTTTESLVDDIREDVAEEVNAPKFTQQWHAQAFGLAMALSRAGVFTWSEWVETFSEVIREEPKRISETSNTAYYRQWHMALEKILLKLGAVDGDELARLAEDWRKSYINTPHGSPIELRRNLTVPEEYEILSEHHHHHHGMPERPKPAAISRATSPGKR